MKKYQKSKVDQLLDLFAETALKQGWGKGEVAPTNKMILTRSEWRQWRESTKHKKPKWVR